MELHKLAGAGLILASSAWAGLHAALRLRRTHEQLRDLRSALELMSAEIRFASTPFAPLCRRAGEGREKSVRRFFERLAAAGEQSDREETELVRGACAEASLVLPEPATRSLERLFESFGRCDREGQLRQLSLTAEELSRLTEELRGLMEGRCRSYRVLGLSAGAAILLLVL